MAYIVLLQCCCCLISILVKFASSLLIIYFKYRFLFLPIVDFDWWFLGDYFSLFYNHCDADGSTSRPWFSCTAHVQFSRGTLDMAGHEITIAVVDCEWQAGCHQVYNICYYCYDWCFIAVFKGNCKKRSKIWILSLVGQQHTLSFDAFAFFFLFIGRKPTMWAAATNRLQIVVCSCTLLCESDFAESNILFIRCCVHFRQNRFPELSESVCVSARPDKTLKIQGRQ